MTAPHDPTETAEHAGSRPSLSTSLAGLLDPHRSQTPDRLALVDRGRHWTYGELAAAADGLAARLLDAGLAGERVAFMLHNSVEAVLAYIGCWRAGAIAVPLNTRYAPPEIERALKHARPAWLIVDSKVIDRLERVDPAVLEAIRLVAVGEDAADQPVAGRVPGGVEPFAPLLAPGPAPSSAGHPPTQSAAIFFTSGSTGRPKGVVHGHGSALAMLTSTSEALGVVNADDRVQVAEPLVHVSGFIATLTTLHAGGTVFLYDGFDRDAYIAALQENRPTLICTHIDVVAQLVRAPGATGDWFSSLRGLYTGGDTVPASVQRELLDLAGLPIGVGWGMTAAIWLTVQREARLDRDGCIGITVGGAEVRSDEQTGELLVRGPMMMLGYFDDEELTAQTFTDGWLHTGDLGSRDENGTWWFEGRIKDLIVRRTSKITPGEVEEALVRHPAVQLAAVIGVPDPDEGQVPVAFVVLHPGKAVTAGELTAFLRERIAEYKIPARIHFLDSLPLTPSGKIARRELREPES
jgi:long-chain acyl-CoA synthetase